MDEPDMGFPSGEPGPPIGMSLVPTMVGTVDIHQNMSGSQIYQGKRIETQAIPGWEDMPNSIRHVRPDEMEGGLPDHTFVGDIVSGVLSDPEMEEQFQNNVLFQLERPKNSKRKKLSNSPIDSHKNKQSKLSELEHSRVVQCPPEKQGAGESVGTLVEPGSSHSHMAGEFSGTRPAPENSFARGGSIFSGYTQREASNSEHGKVLIVTPVGSEEERKRFVDKSILLSSSIENSNFGKLGFSSTRVNFKKKHVIITMNSERSVDKLLGLTTLGPYKVSVTVPISHKKTVFGLIHPVGLENSLEEIIDSLHMRDDQKLIKVERIFKTINRERVPTRNIKIIFPSSQACEYIYLGRERFRVYPFIQQVVQCYKCQGFGHVAKYCLSKKESCVICAGNHNYKNCPKDKVECKNCRGPHSAGYGGCLIRKEASKATIIQAKEKVTYREALLRIRDAPKTKNLGQTIKVNEGNEGRRPSLIRDDQVAQIITSRQPIHKATADCSTQTHDIKKPQCPLEPDDPQINSVTNTSFIPDLAFFSFIQELLSSIIPQIMGPQPAGKTKQFNSKIKELILKHYEINIPIPTQETKVMSQSKLKHGKRK